MTNIALVPARKGSTRLPGKNTKLLAGRPLLWWTVDAARDSGCYDEIIVCSDDLALVEQAHTRAGVTGFLRGDVPDLQPDIEWVTEVVTALKETIDTFSILRPTSPFRGPETIRRAWDQWEKVADRVDSLRAVRWSTENPGKQWRMVCPVTEGPMEPVLPHGERCDNTDDACGQTWNQPSQMLQPALTQTAGLEIAHSWVLRPLGAGFLPRPGDPPPMRSISGTRIAPFVLEGPESVDINGQFDWDIAEAIVARGEAWWQQ